MAEMQKLSATVEKHTENQRLFLICRIEVRYLDWRSLHDAVMKQKRNNVALALI
jgi:hypothetical protein